MIKKLNNSEFDNWFAIIENDVEVGKFSIDFNNKKVRFHNFWIWEQFRGLGYGKKALSDLIELIKKEGKELLSLWVFKDNLIALNLYKSLGFEVVPSNVPASTYLMELKLI